MSLIIVFNNDDTGRNGKANYNITTYVNQYPIAHDRLSDHTRADGWQKLVKLWANNLVESKHEVKD